MEGKLQHHIYRIFQWVSPPRRQIIVDILLQYYTKTSYQIYSLGYVALKSWTTFVCLCVVLRAKLGTSSILGKYSATELYPQLTTMCSVMLKVTEDARSSYQHGWSLVKALSLSWTTKHLLIMTLHGFPIEQIRKQKREKGYIFKDCC